MTRGISILLPVYNNVCSQLVKNLHEQAESILGLEYEIVIVDDGSTDEQCTKENATLADMENCRYIVLKENMGRARVRNYLASQARYPWMIFLDSDVLLPDMFLSKYLDRMDESVGVICGGTDIIEDVSLAKHNLRCKYESSALKKHSAKQRNIHPYHSFATANFAINKKVMEHCHFDERFVEYGYEDVLFGKALAEHSVPIEHIDNPVILHTFDNNDVYLKKVETAMRTLHTFRDDLCGYSPILAKAQNSVCVCLMRLWHTVFGRAERKNLIGTCPYLPFLNLYKFGYYLNLA